MSTATSTATPGTSYPTCYTKLMTLARENDLIGGTMSILGWDQEVLMPEGGLAYRSDQLALLAKIEHEMGTSSEFADALAECEANDDLTSDPQSATAVNLREFRWSLDRRTKLPAELVQEEAKLSSEGMHTWKKARANENFDEFAPVLSKIIDMLRRKAACYGWAEGGEPWDALAEDYEPGCTAAWVESVFTPLRKKLQVLLDDIMGSSHGPSNAFNEIALPVAEQKAFVHKVAAQFGFEFSRGRLDESTHPFCSGSHCNDIRMTTRFHEDNVNDALGSTMHEAGHGLYEQGLLTKYIGTPMGRAVSLGIHESQSRMWENQVGRSESFWKWCHPLLKEHFGAPVASLTFDDVYGGANIVKPDFIRVEADESTYNIHIMIRFELERAILAGNLEVKDIPDAWNSKYRDYLGLEVPNDSKGCLQDIHWSMTSMGYFPTYTLGNLYCAQFFEKAVEAHPDMVEEFASGQFDTLLHWLRTNIHEQGRKYRAADLVEVVTGKPLSSEPLMRHLESKLRPLYKV